MQVLLQYTSARETALPKEVSAIESTTTFVLNSSSGNRYVYKYIHDIEYTSATLSQHMLSLYSNVLQ